LADGLREDEAKAVAERLGGFPVVVKAQIHDFDIRYSKCKTGYTSKGHKLRFFAIAALLRLAIACYSAPSRLALDAHCSPKKTQFATFRGINFVPSSTGRRSFLTWSMEK
jgi:hypothetical protein